MRGRVSVTPAGAGTPGITTGLQSQVGIIRGCNNKDTMRVLLKHFASLINYLTISSGGNSLARILKQLKLAYVQTAIYDKQIHLVIVVNE